MKRLLLLAVLASTALTVPAQHESNSSEKAAKTQERTVSLWGHVKNFLTREGIPNALITVMDQDSVVIDTLRTFNMGNWNATKNDAGYRLKVPARPQRFIIRAEHPDFETTYVNFEIKRVARNTYFDAPWHLMKPRPVGHDSVATSLTLGEVVVKKTRVKMFYKGDTIVFNADAFNVPDGSMLDALVRQMPGVELKDDGRIMVNGEMIDELTLNGQDFFRGNNKVMLENLPHYTVKNIQVYHKQTERSQYLGRDMEKKRYVMDVILKREYAKGYIANAEVGGGYGESDGDFNDDDHSRPYIARLFGLRYTDHSRLALFGNTNNVNENRKPGSNGDWSPASMPQGRTTLHTAGANLLIDEADKRWKENASVDVAWEKTHNQVLTSTEQFLSNGPSTFGRSMSDATNRAFRLNATNRFELRKPFFLNSHNSLQYSKGRMHSLDRALTATRAVGGSVGEALDSAFALSLNTDLQQSLINRSENRSDGNSDYLILSSINDMTYKLPTGDDVGMTLSGHYRTAHNSSDALQRVDYLKAVGSDLLQRRHDRRPEREYEYMAAPYYRITWLSGVYVSTEYRYLQRLNDDTNDALRDDLADDDNSYHRLHLRRENRVKITPGFTKEGDGRYYNLSLAMRFYSVNEQLHYMAAQTDTTLRQQEYTFSPTLDMFIATHDWMRYYQLNYGLEMKTPDLFQKVNVRNTQNPLQVRLGNPDLIGPTIHRLQMSASRRWKQYQTSFNIGYGLRFFVNQVSQGLNYNTTTGAYTYRPENVRGNWQTYFWSHFSRSLDKDNRFTLSNYMHGDYSRNVDLSSSVSSAASSAASSGVSSYYGDKASSLSHVRNYYWQDRLSLSYRHESLSVGANGHVEYRHATSEEGTIEPVNAWNVNYGATLGYKLPLDIFVDTDLKMYSRRGYGSAELNTNDLVWNASLSRSFLKSRLTLRLEGFDLLGQLSSTTIVINGQGRTETLRNTLPRYVMLHASYKLNKQPKDRAKK